MDTNEIGDLIYNDEGSDENDEDSDEDSNVEELALNDVHSLATRTIQYMVRRVNSIPDVQIALSHICNDIIWENTNSDIYIMNVIFVSLYQDFIEISGIQLVLQMAEF